MACRGVYHALTEEESQQLLQAKGDRAVLEYFWNKDGQWDDNWSQLTDKAWDAIHRCLSDGSLRCRGKSILEKTVLGGKQLHQGDNYIISYLTPAEVKAVSEAIKDITEAWFRKKYFGLQKNFLGFKYSNYDGPIDEDDFGYSWAYFTDIRDFFANPATAGRATVFTVDQ